MTGLQRRQQGTRAIPVLDMRRMDLGRKRHLAGIVAAFLAARFDRRHARTVDDGRARVRTTPRPEPLKRRKTGANLLQDPRPGPRVEIGLNRRKRRTIRRSCPPTTPCQEHAGDRVHHVAQVHLTGTTKPARRWKKRVQQGPPSIGQIAFVTLRLTAILLPGGLVPSHDVPHGVSVHPRRHTMRDHPTRPC